MTMTGNFETTPERLKAMGDLARRTVELAHAFIKTGAPSPRAAVSAMFLARAAQAMKSTIMLSAAGYIGDAMSVARTVVELDIEHAYIFAADFEQRWERYVAFESTSLDKIMRAVDLLHGGTADKAALAKLRQDAVAAKQLSGSSRNWAGRDANGGEIDLRVRAETTKRANQYDLCYRDMCGASHGGFSTLRYVLPDQTATVPIQVIVGPHLPSAKPIALALGSLLRLLSDAVDDAKGEEDVDEIFTKLVGVVTDLDALYPGMLPATT
jgi:chemotaxis response regulator CheB